MSSDEVDRLFRNALADRGKHGGGPRLHDPLATAMIAAREELGLSRRALSKLVGCSDVFIGKIESGQKFPSASLLTNLQHVLQLDNEIVQQHVHTRPYQFRMRTSAKAPGPGAVQTSGGAWDDITDHEKAIHLMLATGVALRSSGYRAEPCLPSGEEQSAGVLPWVEVDLGKGTTGVIKIEVKEGTTPE